MNRHEVAKVKKRLKWFLGIPFQVGYLRWLADNTSRMYFNERSLIGISNLDKDSDAYQKSIPVEKAALEIIDLERSYRKRADHLEHKYSVFIESIEINPKWLKRAVKRSHITAMELDAYLAITDTNNLITVGFCRERRDKNVDHKRSQKH